MLAGRVWVRGRLQPLEIGIDEHGFIAALGRSLKGERRHDVGDKVILPAATDLHVHFRDPPGARGTETIRTGTEQAALGGIGLVGEMPNTEPSVSTAELLQEKVDRFRGRAAVDVLLYATPTDPRELVQLARAAGAFKLFLSPTTAAEQPVALGELPKLLATLERFGLPVTVHAEDPALFQPQHSALDPTGWNRCRPPIAEATAVEHLLRAAPPGLRLHVAHVTSQETAVRLLERGVSFEASPHHLLLSERSGGDSRFKVNPPLRSEATRRALWEAFRSGRVPCVASDHAPHSPEAKALPFASAPSGMPGVETMLPLLLARVRSGDLPLSIVLETACDRPARWLGQPMGRIALGHRARLLVVDFRARTTIRADRLHGPCGWSAFEGAEAIFPVEHWRDGERIVSSGEYTGRPFGAIVRPEFAPRGPSSELPSDG